MMNISKGRGKFPLQFYLAVTYPRATYTASNLAVMSEEPSKEVGKSPMTF